MTPDIADDVDDAAEPEQVGGVDLPTAADRGDLLTVREAAQVLRISPQVAQRWARQGQLPGLCPPIGRTYRVSARALYRYVTGD